MAHNSIKKAATVYKTKLAHSKKIPHFGNPNFNNKAHVDSIINKASKLHEIRMRLEEKKIKEKEELEYLSFKDKYSTQISTSLDDIDFLIDNILNKNDIFIEKDYNQFVLRMYFDDGTHRREFHIRIDANNINLSVEDNKNNYYDNIDLMDTTLYEKWYEKLEEKYFDALNRKSKKIFNSICGITKLNRKNIVDKLIDKDNSSK